MRTSTWVVALAVLALGTAPPLCADLIVAGGRAEPVSADAMAPDGRGVPAGAPERVGALLSEEETWIMPAGAFFVGAGLYGVHYFLFRNDRDD